jgi:uncharacterized protein (DUF58 family)
MPTARGWTVLVVGVALGAAGLVAGYREFVAVGTVGVVSVILAAAWVGRPPRLVVDRSFHPGHVRRDEPCRAVIDVHTTSRSLRAVTLTDPTAGPGGTGLVTIGPLRVRGGMPVRADYELPTHRRGPLHVGPLSLGRNDVLGLCRARQTVGEPTCLLVRPRWHPLPGLPPGFAPSLDGNADLARHGSIAFHSLREYRWGDELRHVHWRSSARVGTLLVREFVDTALPRLTILLDDRAGSYPGDGEAAEHAIEAAASILVATAGAGLPVTLRLIGGDNAAAETGPGLDLLARMRLLENAEPAAIGRRLASEEAGCTVILLTGADADLAATVATGSRHSRLVVVAFGSTAAEPAPPPGVTVHRAASIADFVAAWVRLWT